MANSTTPKQPEHDAAGEPECPWAGPQWEALKLHLPVVVALSGGADSTALLMACRDKWPGQVHAIHINHGLQAAASDFEAHCRTLCDSLSVPLHCEHLKIRPVKGESLEQVARDARYEALIQRVKLNWPQGATVMLAHHADDQVETVLLALLRGAGLPGLSAMPERFERQGVLFVRPWLQVKASSIRAWLGSKRQSWVEDPSNQNLDHTRNRIRLALGPVLDAHFPAHRQTLARSARHAAQAQLLLQELANEDLTRCGDPPRIVDLRTLSPDRRANALRAWLKRQGLRASAAQLDELVSQVQACSTGGHRIELKVGTGQVVRKGEVLVGYNPALSRGLD